MTVNRCKYARLVLAILGLAMLGPVENLPSAQRQLVRPADMVTTRLKANISLQPHEIRKGSIILAPELLPPPPAVACREARMAASSAEPDTVTVSFFPDITYEVIVDSIKHDSDSTTVLNGRLIDHRMATVVLTIGPDGFYITLQNVNQGILYRAAGDAQSGTGTVTEIDMTKIPPMIR